MNIKNLEQENLRNLLIVKEFKIEITKVGDKEDYLHLPFTKNDSVVGIVTKVEETKNKYKLTIRLWQDAICNKVVTEGSDGTLRSIGVKYIDLYDKYDDLK